MVEMPIKEAQYPLNSNVLSISLDIWREIEKKRIFPASCYSCAISRCLHACMQLMSGIDIGLIAIEIEFFAAAKC